MRRCATIWSRTAPSRSSARTGLLSSIAFSIREFVIADLAVSPVTKITGNNPAEIVANGRDDAGAGLAASQVVVAHDDVRREGSQAVERFLLGARDADLETFDLEQQARGFGDGTLVVDDQHAPARAAPCAAESAGDGLRELGARYRHAKHGSLADDGLDLHAAAEQLLQAPHDREPEAEALGPLRAAIDLIELLEHALELIGRYPDTGIANLDRELRSPRRAHEIRTSPRWV